jgi:protein TonB
MTSFGAGLVAFGFSAVLHAAVLLVPVGHPPGPSRGTNDEAVNVEVAVEPTRVPDAPEPEPTVAPPAGHAASWPTHTHPYPVPASHDWTPHDPNLEHPHAPSATPPLDPPALASPADTTDDETPRFTIAIGTATAGNGVVSPSGAAPSHEQDAEPFSEHAVDAQARLVRGLAPSYPDAARADGIEGDVHLELVVGVSGAVESARVVRGVGHGLDEAALRAVRQFRFAPANKAGHAVRVRMGWAMQFRLE